MKCCESCVNDFDQPVIPNGIISMWFGSLEAIPKLVENAFLHLNIKSCCKKLW